MQAPYRLLDVVEAVPGFCRKLAMAPNPILGPPPAGILLLLVTVDLHIAGDRLDMLKKFSLELVLIARIVQLDGAYLENQPVRPIPPHQDILRGGQRFLG